MPRPAVKVIDDRKPEPLTVSFESLEVGAWFELANTPLSPRLKTSYQRSYNPTTSTIADQVDLRMKCIPICIKITIVEGNPLES